MRFKSLELIGFKSFADKTRFEFEPGVTAIVGPNGCGKSNVADAIRWVLGEQSARSLRGAKMEDVIFSGSDLRKPLGLAEVSLTLTGADKALPVDYHEITVTRRVLRSGEGQYFINKAPCRLKDINDLFAGTGIGLSAYSIIAQGQIDMILSTKPEDRRFIFEEAAGITRYKEKKRQALRKLESTEENLLRLSDIVNEVRRQLASVERQAKRARRAKEIGDRLRTVDLQSGARKLSLIDDKLGEIGKKHAAAKEGEKRVTDAIAELEAAQDSLRKQLLSLDREMGSVQAKRVGVTGSIENNRNRVVANERLIEELDEAAGRLRREIGTFEKSVESLREDSRRLESSAELIGRECRETGTEIETTERELGELRRGAVEKEESLKKARVDLVETINLIAKLRNELAALKSRLRSSALRTTRLQVEERELAEKIEQARRSLGEKRSQRDARTTEAERETGRLRELGEELERARAREGALLQRRLENEKTLAEYESTLAVLSRYKESREGLDEGVRAVLAEAGKEGAGLGGIHGVLAEKMEVSPEYERAIEAALGDALQHIVVETRETARRAFELLPGHGKAAFIPIEGLQSPVPSVQIEAEGVLGSALDLVSVEPPFVEAVRHLLANTYIVRDLSAAFEIAGSSPPGVRLVTVSGELVVAQGELRKLGKDRGASPLISANNEMESVRARIESSRSARDEIAWEIESSREGCRSLAETVSEEHEKLTQKKIALAEARTEEARTAAALEQRKAEREAAAGELSDLSNQRREDERRDRALGEEISASGARESSLQETLTRLQEESESTIREREARDKAFTELKVAFAASSARENNIKENLQRVSGDISRIEESIREKREQVRRSTERKSALIEEISSLKIETEALLAEKDTNDTDAKGYEEKRAAIYERQRGTDARLRDEIGRLASSKDGLTELEIVIVEEGAKRDGLLERMREQYGVELAGVELDPEITDWAAIEEEVELLRGRLKRLGPVNMVALEEHRELDERLRFLTEQEEDLLSSKDSLQKAINRINAETTRMFSETFSAIRAQFREIYKELFGGGNADLTIEEGVDILEAGINIVARPPGKKAQNISLLSGGEKALTAISLLFAIFRVKPSPFCLLDEIDAPLDESNINRFLKLLERFLEKSQFIIVTHNKRTISMSDIMYGITMEESGVSKVVSVRFAKGRGGGEGPTRKAGPETSDLYERAKKVAPAESNN